MNTPIPTKDLLPAADTGVLFWHAPSNRWRLGWWNAVSGRWEEEISIIRPHNVTHWMPLPERPQ